MKKYQVTREVRAMKAADLLKEMTVAYGSPLIEKYPELLRAMGDGRLKFGLDSVILSGNVLDDNDYVVLGETGELIHVTNKYFNKNFVAI